MQSDPHDKSDITPGGSHVWRHEPNPGRDFKPAEFLTEEDMTAVSAHFAEHVGEIETVLHELASDTVHVDINVIPPGEGLPYLCLTTMGMCALPMTTPEGYPHPDRAELCIFLPPEWPVSEEAFEDENVYWPIRWLKSLARLPFEYDTFLGFGHTIPNGDPADPVAPDVGFLGMLLVPAMLDGLDSLQVAGRDVGVLQLVPLYAEEMDLKLEHGTDALLELFENSGLDPLDLATPGRPNVALG